MSYSDHNQASGCHGRSDASDGLGLIKALNAVRISKQLPNEVVMVINTCT